MTLSFEGHLLLMIVIIFGRMCELLGKQLWLLQIKGSINNNKFEWMGISVGIAQKFV